ncbi:hypothetical protein F4782DRAFT_515853 [Xylaria castorea]|nr:hypothetical protein F4782DRAFT_515853 [Xylaria castorea]
MSSIKKRKSHDNDDPSTATPTKVTDIVPSKKRRRVSAGEEGGEVSKLEGKKKKKSKKDKKKVSAASEETELETQEQGGEAEADVDPSAAKDVDTIDPKSSSSTSSSKKSSKKDKKKKTTAPTDSEPTASAPTTAEAGAEAEEAEPDSDAKKRFIVFVGNLPYSATAEHITTHFSSVHPTAVRLLHQKNAPSRSRGIAFVEFARYDHMKTALKLFHHSVFKCPSPSSSSNGRGGRDRQNSRGNKWGGNTAGEEAGMEERKINVELTAGGGGNTEYRKERIRAKNEKLNEERIRRAQEEARVRDKKDREKGEKGGDKAEAEEEKSTAGAVHPSRRRRVHG